MKGMEIMAMSILKSMGVDQQVQALVQSGAIEKIISFADRLEKLSPLLDRLENGQFTNLSEIPASDAGIVEGTARESAEAQSGSGSGNAGYAWNGYDPYLVGYQSSVEP